MNRLNPTQKCFNLRKQDGDGDSHSPFGPHWFDDLLGTSISSASAHEYVTNDKEGNGAVSGAGASGVNVTPGLVGGFSEQAGKRHVLDLDSTKH